MQDQLRFDAAETAGSPILARTADAADLYGRARLEFDTGEASIAQALYLRCLSLDPRHAKALHDLGVIAARQGGDDDRAIQLLEQAIAIDPDHPEVRVNLCIVLTRAARLDEAIATGRGAVATSPRCADAAYNLGVAFEAADEMEEAVRCFRSAAAIEPGSAAPFIKLANGLRRLARLDDALECADRGVALDAGHFGARVMRGLIRDGLGLFESAGEDFRAAFALCPPSAEALNFLGVICTAHGRLDEAVEILSQAARLGPDQAEPHGNLGFALHKQGRVREAFDAYVTTVTIDPTHVVAQCNLGGLLIEINQFDAAVSACRLAAKGDPASIQAHVGLGIALHRKGRTADALAACRHILDRHPESGEVLIEICDLRRQACDWDGLEAQQTAAMEQSYRKGLRVPPFQVLTMTDSAAEQQAAARLWASGFLRKAQPLASPTPRPANACGRPLKIGYLSADLRTHATAMLIAELFELQDRRRFELFGYSYGEDDGSPMRGRLVAALDHFRDIRALSHLDAARRIRADDIDILIDLKGYTLEGRPEILVRRPAPIQVNFLGYPGTMGAGFIDYLIADHFIVRPEDEAFIDEKIVRLPHSYQPNDSRRVMAQNPPTRAACGLPEEGFVFCCLNNNYKITPAMFEIWMRLLRGTPGAVLWLFEGDRSAPDNLRRAAKAHNVDPARLIFAPKRSPEAHLARLPLADLFLDTMPVNAHTTASEALWAGLPVVTLAGGSFVSRVAGSLLHAVGLSDLVTSSPAEYEALAASLAGDPGRLAHIRARLHEARQTAPLFDSPRYTRNFEAALERMAALRDEGRPPETFAVAEPPICVETHASSVAD